MLSIWSKTGRITWNSSKIKLKDIDLEAAALRTGGRFENDRLTIKVMGKDFSVTAAGTFSTDIHVNPWVAAPFLYYVLAGKGLVAHRRLALVSGTCGRKGALPAVSEALRRAA